MPCRIPVYRPRLEGNEKRYVNECLDTTWISSKGRFILEFEQGFSRYIGSPHAVSVCNGTVALHVALLALGIGPGDEVIVPSLTYVASVNAISYTGARPIFVDSCERSWQMDADLIEGKITKRTKAIMPVHLYGHACDMDAIGAIAHRHDLRVIEDCAESFGSLYKGKHTGTFGDIATFSFFGNKTITCGEGGMVVTSHAKLRDRVSHLKGQGVDPNRTYWHDVIGYNYRMTNIEAAIGLAQLERAEETIQAKIRLAQWYDKALAGLPLTTHRPLGDVRHTYWMYSVLVPENRNRDRVMQHMADHGGIETRPVFYPAHTLPMYASLASERYPVAERLAAQGMNLPSWPGLTESDVAFIVRALADALDAGDTL